MVAPSVLLAPKISQSCWCSSIYGSLIDGYNECLYICVFWWFRFRNLIRQKDFTIFIWPFAEFGRRERHPWYHPGIMAGLYQRWNIMLKTCWENYRRNDLNTAWGAAKRLASFVLACCPINTHLWLYYLLFASSGDYQLRSSLLWQD